MTGHRRRRERAVPGGAGAGSNGQRSRFGRPAKEGAPAGSRTGEFQLGPRRIAVLPPVDLSGCPAIDGLSLKIAHCILEGLRAAGQASVLGWVDQGSQPNDVTVGYLCRSLGAEMLVLGQARWLAQRVGITLELRDGSSGEKIWSGSYECDPQLAGQGFAAMCGEIAARAALAAAARGRR
ncbi:MAG: hypothetical protein KatS3mg081_1353 [Gemmatimonadales bacterium]|nr:MAG: hypothetical protein KatS3mg081_1353 [Gemmatimonadales bacterium]